MREMREAQPSPVGGSSLGRQQVQQTHTSPYKPWASGRIRTDPAPDHFRPLPGIPPRPCQVPLETGLVICFCACEGRWWEGAQNMGRVTGCVFWLHYSPLCTSVTPSQPRLLRGSKTIRALAAQSCMSSGKVAGWWARSKAWGILAADSCPWWRGWMEGTGKKEEEKEGQEKKKRRVPTVFSF